MLLDIHDIGPQGLSFDHTLTPRPLGERAGEAPTFRETRIHGKARPAARGVELEAHFDADVGLACSRCLEPVSLALSRGFRLILVSEAVPPVEEELEMRPEDALLYTVEGGRVDLEAVVREQIYLDLPLKPVCAPDCRGLCPTCGVNRNRLECDCRTEQADPRLAELARIRERMDET